MKKETTPSRCSGLTTILEKSESLNRPAWTSEYKTGMFFAYKHLHTGNRNVPVVREYFEKNKKY